MPVVTFRLAPTIHKRFFEVCQERETTVSAVLQKAVEGFIDRVDDAVVAEVRADMKAGGTGVIKMDQSGNFTRVDPSSIFREPERKAIGFDMKGEPIYARPLYQKKGK